ncbi:hypothetical protein NDU88_004755 [Pleurodeles waltl]|uniref:Uncharacterized protein n=1 Tax=Pleurodeles waltl TaxID=8319 RepID=A0AAV7LQB0_PLEWA|nr:hypothetical protein NDU88_004755 [Pleurodeles waltl]
MSAFSRASEPDHAPRLLVQPSPESSQGGGGHLGPMTTTRRPSGFGYASGCRSLITVRKTQILSLNLQCQSEGTPDFECQLAAAQEALKQLSLEEARQCWRASKWRVYMFGDKTGKLLY